jgi:hypothetical protein
MGGEPYLLLRLSKEGEDSVGVSSRKAWLAPFTIGLVGGVVAFLSKAISKGW